MDKKTISIGKAHIAVDSLQQLSAMGTNFQTLFGRVTWFMGNNNQFGTYFLESIVHMAHKVSLTDAWILKQNNRIGILRSIKSIEMPFLKVLDISGNNILSIETISQLNTPNITKLYLANNELNSMKALRKTHMNKISWIDIHGNKLVDSVNSQCLDQLLYPALYGIRYERASQQNKISEEITWMYKLQSKHFHQIWLQSPNRRQNRESYPKLKAKYPNILILM